MGCRVGLELDVTEAAKPRDYRGVGANRGDEMLRPNAPGHGQSRINWARVCRQARLGAVTPAAPAAPQCVDITQRTQLAQLGGFTLGFAEFPRYPPRK